MAGVQILPKAGEQTNHEFQIVGAIVDGDVGKPVKLTTTSGRVELCDDGDVIFGFINSVERGTDAGYVVVGVVTKGRVRCTTSGTVAVGALVEAAANTAAGTDIVKWGLVSTHAAAAGEKQWMAITGGTTGTDITIETV